MLVQPSPHLEMVLFSGQWCRKGVWRRDGMLGESCCLLGDSWIPELCGLSWTCEVFLSSKNLCEKQQVLFSPTQNDKSSQHIEERIPVDVWAFSLPEPQHSTLVLQLRLNEAHADQRNAHISDEEWRLRLAGRVHFASLLPQVQYLCECVCTHVHWLLSVCILYKPGRIFWKCVPCGWWNEKAFFFGGHISPLPSAQDCFHLLSFMCVFFLFFMLLLLFWFVCVTVKCYQLFMI